MAGRHRRPPAWRRGLSSTTAQLARLVRTRDRARSAALLAEVVALRTTLGQLRAALADSEETVARLTAELAADRPVATGPVLELPLVRLALDRADEPPLTREMTLALVAADRGADTATTDIVLAEPAELPEQPVLPEKALLDPVADRGAELTDAATSPRRGTEAPVRRTA